MRIAVLGGSGTLGSAVVANACAAGHTAVAISRRAPASLPAGASHAIADVMTGEGITDLTAALAGADAMIDGINASQLTTSAEIVEAVMLRGTERVLQAGKAAGVGHFVGVSIVGIDHAPLDYYRTKVAQERVVEASPIPWSLVRATQFHDLIPRFVTGKLGFVAAPIGWSLQPIDVRDVARLLVAAAVAGPAGRLPDIGGPEVIPVRKLARAWVSAAKLRRVIVPVPVPGKLGAFLRSGQMCCPDRAVGTVTFASWLAERFARA
jgi:uncharacterized protein YbjT (DUF2867 family)